MSQVVQLVGLLLGLGLMVVLLTRLAQIRSDFSFLSGRLEGSDRQLDRLEKGVKEEIAASRGGLSEFGSALRQELLASVTTLSDNIVATIRGMTAGQEERLSGFASVLSKTNESLGENARQLRDEVGVRHTELTTSILNGIARFGESQKGQLDSFSTQLSNLTGVLDRKFGHLQASVEQQLQKIRTDNENKLEEMRKTVDEKLQGTLERRLADSFRIVSERLETVHKGLGEMQKLAQGVGDLKKVLTNVKARGTWGEVTMSNLLEEMLAPEQFGRNVATREGSGERVEFAIRLPGRKNDADEPVWLPLDSKFPKEAYERLVDASEVGDLGAMEAAGKDLEKQVRGSAASISEKYLNPPTTTDFAIMFLASEGLYSEVIRRPGLVDEIQRKYRVAVVGPNTFAAFLNTLQMGFRTLAIEKRSAEVWTILAAVKSEFGKFEAVLEKVKKKLDQASETIGAAETRTRVINRRLRTVEQLPEAEARRLLPADAVWVDLEEKVEPGLN